MTHNERGLRIDGAPGASETLRVKRHDVVVEVLVRVDGSGSKDQARARAEVAIDDALTFTKTWTEERWAARLLGRPNAKRAQLAPEDQG